MGVGLVALTALLDSVVLRLPFEKVLRIGPIFSGLPIVIGALALPRTSSRSQTIAVFALLGCLGVLLTTIPLGAAVRSPLHLTALVAAGLVPGALAGAVASIRRR